MEGETRAEVGEVKLLTAVPLMAVPMPLPTSRLPSMVPPVQEKLPVPVKPPVPRNVAPPVWSTVVPAAIDTPVARVILALWSNSSVPPPLMPALG